MKEDVHYKMTLSYDGTRYKGWQRLKTSEATIQQKVESVLSRIFGQDIEIHGSGRTDAGVHAKNQVAHFKSAKRIEPKLLKEDLNRFLPEDIAIKDIAFCASDFHARFNATEKTYVYTLWTADYPPVFERDFVWDMPNKRLDLYKMKQAVPFFIGKHDFKGFSTDKTKKSTTRTIYDITFEQDDTQLKIIFRGDGFLYNMVRILVGTMLEIGLGTRELSSITDIFQTQKREKAGETAPSKGLTLDSVKYEHEER